MRVRKEIKGARTAGEIQQVHTRLCMMGYLHRKFLTLQPEQAHIRAHMHPLSEVCVNLRLYQDQLLQINNSALSLSAGTLGKTGR